MTKMAFYRVNMLKLDVQGLPLDFSATFKNTAHCEVVNGEDGVAIDIRLPTKTDDACVLHDANCTGVFSSLSFPLQVAVLYLALTGRADVVLDSNVQYQVASRSQQLSLLTSSKGKEEVDMASMLAELINAQHLMTDVDFY
jgi:hypothetical protein